MSRPEARNLISIDILYNFIVEFILPEMLFPFIPSSLPLEGVAIRVTCRAKSAPFLSAGTSLLLLSFLYN